MLGRRRFAVAVPANVPPACRGEVVFATGSDHLPCPARGAMQAPTWEANVDLERSRVVCRDCGAPMDLLVQGTWRAEAPGNADIHGYHLGLYSPWANLPAMIAASQAETPSGLQEFHNSDLGEVFSPPGAGLSLDAIDRCRRDYTLEEYAGQPCDLGVDVGIKLHVVIREHVHKVVRRPNGVRGERRDRPPRLWSRRLSREAEAEIIAVRERSGGGPEVVGAIVDRPASTVGKVLRRLGCSRLPKPPRPPVVRYERERPGELVHIDTKKLGRFWHVGKRILRDGVQRSPRAGWQHVHVAVDDHTRLAYAEVLPSDRRADALAFLERALRWYREQGITVEEVMTDNGSAYRSRAWRERCEQLGLRHRGTRPYTPRATVDSI